MERRRESVWITKPELASALNRSDGARLADIYVDRDLDIVCLIYEGGNAALYQGPGCHPVRRWWRDDVVDDQHGIDGL